MKRNLIMSLILAAASFLLAGCWDKRELTDLAIVSALGLDINESGQYVGTFQIVIPSNVASGLQGGGGENLPIAVYKAEADNLIDLHGQLSGKISRQPYYAHTNVIVISEKLAAEEGIAAVFDGIDRGIEFRNTTKVVIARGEKAEMVVQTLTGIDKLPSEKIIKMISLNELIQGEHFNTRVHDVIHTLVSPGSEPLISGVSLKGSAEDGDKQENLQSAQLETAPYANGMAVFKEDKLIGWLDDDLARGTTWAMDKLLSTNLNLDWKDQKNAIAFQVSRQQTEVRVDIKHEKPVISIHVQAEGDIMEVKQAISLNDPHVLADIEKEMNKAIEQDILHSVQKVQQYHADVFGFGEAVHRKDPTYWNKVKKTWDDEMFPSLTVQVNAESFVRRTGLRNKSYWSSIDS